jgi:tRNA G18 (ribose-2'-O)-methylase SpoU
MFNIQKIVSLDLPELAPYRTLKRPLAHEAEGIFVAEGDKVVRLLLASRFTTISVVMPEHFLAEFTPLLQARPENIEVFLAPNKQVLQELIGFTMYQGVLAIGKIPETITLNDTLARSSKPRLLAAIDGLASAENVGVLVRNCAAFGAHALIVGETSSSPFLRRAVRNSMGTLFDVPVVELAKLGQRHQFTDKPHDQHQTLVECLKYLRWNGVRCLAAHPQEDCHALWQADFAGDSCVVFGSEGTGISPQVLAVCDDSIAIPMAPGVDSLNVGAAAAVFLYEAIRQRMIAAKKNSSFASQTADSKAVD